jgi:hypothetical protein
MLNNIFPNCCSKTIVGYDLEFELSFSYNDLHVPLKLYLQGIHTRGIMKFSRRAPSLWNMLGPAVFPHSECCVVCKNPNAAILYFPELDHHPPFRINSVTPYSGACVCKHDQAKLAAAHLDYVEERMRLQFCKGSILRHILYM